MNDPTEIDFHDALLLEGMEDGSDAVAAALRAFRRWREMPRVAWSRDRGVNWQHGTFAEYERDLKINGPLPHS